MGFPEDSNARISREENKDQKQEHAQVPNDPWCMGTPI